MKETDRRRAPLVWLVVALALTASEGPALAHGMNPEPRAAAVAGPATNAEMIAARQRFFGQEHVDTATGAVVPGKVILSWAGVSTFAAAIGGHVVLLDAWIPDESHQGYVPATAGDLAKLAPEAVFVGHSHFDHALDAGTIAAATGAVVVGTPAHCTDARRRAAGMGEVRCVEAMPQSAPFGETRPLGLLPGVEIVVVRHRHSPGLSPESLNPESFGGGQGDSSCPAHLDYEQTLRYPPEIVEGLRTLVDYGTTGDGGVLMYRFSFGSFSLAWEDSSASLGATPGLEAALRRLPPSDVFVGSLASLNQGTRCMRDPRLYAEALRARMFVPNHHDNNLYFPLSGPGAAYEQALIDELRRAPAERRPCLRFVVDPRDYIRPEVLTFDVAREDPCTAADTRVSSRCLAHRSPIGPRNIGRVRLGYTRRQALQRIGPQPTRRSGRSYRWCVKRSRGNVKAVFDKRRRIALVTTTARSHGNRGVRPGSSLARVADRYPRSGPLGRGLYRAGPASTRLIGTREGRVRFVAVARTSLLSRRTALRRHLRLAGL